ncbi:MAG: DUF1538 domain-containing protein [Bacilli bacterium]|nr:DUF1538 domain-containing protein [Bacilli bacterium]
MQRIKESFLSVLPIALVVLIIYFAGIDSAFSYSHDVDKFGYLNELAAFLICAFLVAIGLGLFSIGVDQSLGRIGSVISDSLTKKKKKWFLIIVTFLLGFLITVAEPDLRLLSSEVGIDDWIIVLSVSLGVGLFLVLGTLRILFQLDLRVVFLGVYAVVFMLVALAPEEFYSIAFDAGGVTTGPVTIPFILAFGTSVASSRQDSKNGSDDFGLIAHATMGPILAILFLAIFIPVANPSFTMSYVTPEINLELSVEGFSKQFISSLGNVGLAIGPLALFFLVYNFLFLKMNLKELMNIFIGLFFCYFGLVFFLSAVQTGFSPVAQSIGKALSSSEQGYSLALFIGALFGCFAVLAEPAVAVLVHQIQLVSEGTIKKSGFLTVTALAIALGVALAVIRAKYRFSIMYYLVPGYIISFGLSFLVPNIYSSIAYDAGTVASGPMAASFTMPFIIGFATGQYDSSSASFSSDIYKNAFGVVAMISMMPLIVVQLVGLYAVLKRKAIIAKARKRIIEPNDDQIIHFEAEGNI